MNTVVLRSSACLRALALITTVTAATFFPAISAAAQDYTTGVLRGTVTDPSGTPVVGATVIVRSLQQATTQSVSTAAGGDFSIPSLPVGEYDVTVTAGGKRTFTATAVDVVPGRTTSVPIVLTSRAAEAANEIVVVGRRIEAFSGTTTGLNVDVDKVTRVIPVERTLVSVIQLAPGTSHGDAAFGELASINGASVAENAYYINGLNITNFVNYLGSAPVPFDFYKSVEVKTGGYPAEFGRATGGIVNAISKSGTNDWLVGLHVSWAPNFLRAGSRNICIQPNCDLAHTIYLASGHREDELNTSAELGGPVLPDHLFVYGLLQLNRHRWRDVNPNARTAFEYRNNDPFWGVKVDAYPIQSQHLEFTIFDTMNRTNRGDAPFVITDGQPNYGAPTAVTGFYRGGLEYAGKYTGRFTDWLTLSAAYGRMRDRFDNVGIAGAAGLPVVRTLSVETVNGVPFGGYYNGQRIGTISSPYNSERKFWRGDFDLNFNLLGSNHIRGGFDFENDKLVETVVPTGQDFLCSNGYLSSQACTANISGGGAIYIIRAPAGGVATPQVEINYYNSGGQFIQKNNSIYLEDEWAPTDRLTISAGVRRDDFRVTNAAREGFAVLNNNWQPRIGVTYKVRSDKSAEIKAFFGEYYLPFASNTAFRYVGGEYFVNERYYLSGFDANNMPILGAQVTNNGSFQSTCPLLLTPQSSGQYCSLATGGLVPNADWVIARNLKATLEAEWIFGYQQRWRGWTFGVAGTYRKLIRESEDLTIDDGARAYCADRGILDQVNPDTGLTCAEFYSGLTQFVISNPGSPVTVTLPGVAGNPVVTLTPEQLGYPKARRTYKAFEFTFDRPYDGVWSLSGSYTLSYARGNSEGFVQSDFGQTDAGITQDFDDPGFVAGANGYLPNDRRHRIKIQGAYTFWRALTLGANIDIESPRPLSCFGFNPVDAIDNVYGPASHYCNGQLSPRGTAQHSDWLTQVNTKLAYRLALHNRAQLLLHADIFNLFNSHAVLKRHEFGDLDVGDYDPNTGLPTSYIPNPRFGLPTVYQAPRYIRLGLDVLWGGS